MGTLHKLNIKHHRIQIDVEGLITIIKVMDYILVYRIHIQWLYHLIITLNQSSFSHIWYRRNICPFAFY